METPPATTLQHLVDAAARRAPGAFAGAWGVATRDDGGVVAFQKDGHRELVLGVDLFLRTTDASDDSAAGRWVASAGRHEVSFWIFQSPPAPKNIPALVPEWSHRRRLFVQLGAASPDYAAFLQAEKLWHGVRICTEPRDGWISACVAERAGATYEAPGGGTRTSQTIQGVLAARGFPRDFSCLFVGKQHWRCLASLGQYAPRFIVLWDVQTLGTALALLPDYTLVAGSVRAPVRVLSRISRTNSITR